MHSSVDIIVPHFNGSDKIKRLMDSIPKNDWLTVYVIDDHSDKIQYDAICELGRCYSNVKILQVPKGQKGPGIARNYGISVSKSPWILFADVDDFFIEGAFSKIKRWLCSSLDVIFFSPTSIIEGTDRQSHRHLSYSKLVEEYQKSADHRLFYRFFPPWSKLISRKLILKNNIWFDDGVGGEDNNFSLKVAFYAKKISACTDEIYCVSESEDSLTSMHTPQVLINHYNAMCRFNDFLQLHCESQYQVPMLGWVVKGRKISLITGLKWFWYCFTHGYPLSPKYYLYKK